MLVCPQRSAVRYQGSLASAAAEVIVPAAVESSRKVRLVTRRSHLLSVHIKARCSWCGEAWKGCRTFGGARGFGFLTGDARESNATDYKKGAGQNPIGLAS